MTPGQQLALDQLRQLERAPNGAWSVVDASVHGGLLFVDLSVSCKGLPAAREGVPLRDRERFEVIVLPSFPLSVPLVRTRHTRWAGTPHVQWGKQLCLYAAPETQWDPSDGMFGLAGRLHEWLRAAAAGELDPLELPLHPPVTYTVSGTPTFVVRADTPRVDDEWAGFAYVEHHGENRIDIVGWDNFADVDLQRPFIPALLLPGEFPFEYPDNLQDLFSELEAHGWRQEPLVRLLSLGARLTHNDDEYLYVVLGTAMRGRANARSQHLTVWQMGRQLTGFLRSALPQEGDTEEIAAIRARMDDNNQELLNLTDVRWCRVMEDRDEVTRPRDEGSPARWWSGRKVEVWGCGAIGGRVAEHLVRAGVRDLTLRDNGRVTPGILVRQNFKEGDLTRFKVEALRERLLGISPGASIDTFTDDLTRGVDLAPALRSADVIVDATASARVALKVDATLRDLDGDPRADVLSFIVGREARRGIATLTPAGAHGPWDLMRRVKIAAVRDPDLKGVAGDFWPSEPRTDLFHPEPGCSDPTFTGSDVDVAALVAGPLRELTRVLADADGSPAEVAIATELDDGTDGGWGRSRRIDVHPQVTVAEQLRRYEIRFSRAAHAKLFAEVRRAERADPFSETGGFLYGQRDEYLRVVWVTDALGPPPDSVASPEEFVPAIDGVDDATKHFNETSRGSSVPVGVWHTHPWSDALPSPRDHGTVNEILADEDRPHPHHLLVIVGGDATDRHVGAYLYHRDRPVRTVLAADRLPDLPPPEVTDARIGLALSGGGFRAVAFHLGAMRALHDRGLLDRVDVLSTISGGSIVGAMWAYRPGTFADFDHDATNLLRRGLTRPLLRRALLSRRAPQALAYRLIAAASAMLPTDTAARAVTRTTALEDVLNAELFADARVGDVARDVTVVVNACDLTYTSAFRFGSEESGSSRHGRITGNDVTVARAVAASAAFPPVFPAIDDTYHFDGLDDGDPHDARVLLTDGGVFDNLGITPMLPGRSPAHSTNVHPVDYIISCDAGQGVPRSKAHPAWWPSRMRRAFEVTHRKLQDAGRHDLHQHLADGTLAGFAMSYLGQQDHRLPLAPPDLVPRDAVYGYPTDLSSMTDETIRLLARRGEQLMHATVEAYLPHFA